MFRENLVFISSLVLLSVLSAAEFPSDIKKCTTTDTDCQKGVLQDIISKYYDKGHRGLNMVPFDPLKVKSLVLPKVQGSPVGVELEFNDIELSGMKGAKINSVSGMKKDGPNNHIYEANVTFPFITLTGPYIIDGQVLVLAIKGQGDCKITFKNINGKIKGKISIVEKDGKKYLHIDKILLDLNPEGAEFLFKNLFKGDAALGDNMNKFLNENWLEVYTELKPTIMEAMGKIMLQVGNNVYSTFEYSDIFLPD